MNIKSLITALLILSGAATLASASTINELEVNGSAGNNDTLASGQLAATGASPSSSANGYQASPSVRTGKSYGDNSPFFVKGAKDYFDIDGAFANFYRLLGLLKPNAKLVVPPKDSAPKDSASATTEDETTTDMSQEASNSSVASDASDVNYVASTPDQATYSSATISADSSSAYFISPIQTAQYNVLTASPVQNAPAKVPLPSSVLLFGVGAVTLLLLKSGTKKAPIL